MGGRVTPESALDLFAVVPFGILSVTREGRVQGGNFAAARLLDVPLKDLAGRSLPVDLAPPSERDRLVALLQEERFDDRLVVLRGSDGHPRTLRASGRPLSEGVLALVLRDPSVDRARERARLIEEKMQSLGRMASGVAHEFGNVMATLSGYAQLADRDPAMRDALVQAVRQSADRVRAVTEALRAFERAPSGESEPFDVGDVTRKVLSALGPEIERAQVQIERRLDERGEVLGQRASIEEAVLAIVRNAVEATPPGGTVTVALENVEQNVVLTVIDTGPGVPEEVRDRIFDPFFTTKGSLGGGPASASGGLGLGLAIAWNRVREQEGDISLESPPGQGATFRIVLPGRVAPRRDHTITKKTRGPRRRARRSILVVDSDATSRALVEAVLKGDHWVRAVSSAHEALAAYEEPRAFDYVVLDLALEGSPSGPEVFRTLMERDPRARIVVLSSRAASDDSERACAAQAYALLKKPEGLRDVRDLIA
jgi:signal transduction histidine kinase/CheY-like chemotaxis protein